MCRRTLGTAFGDYARLEAKEFKWTYGKELIAKLESPEKYLEVHVANAAHH